MAEQEEKIDAANPSKFVPKDYRIKDINNDSTIPYVYNFINGEYCLPSSGEYIDNINPATNCLLSRIASSNAADVDFAVQCASKAFDSWSKTPINKRAEYLFKISNLIKSRLQEFATLESRDNGKPKIMATMVDVPASIKSWKQKAEYAKYVETDALVRNDSLYYLQRPPLGVVGGIIPWNYPLLLVSDKIAPAIIYGNTVIIKPSELTPMTAYLLTDIIIESGLPKGVVNILHGYGKTAGSPIVKHPKIRAISFTGGSETGRIVAADAAMNIKKVHLELGGKNPTLICDDCNLNQCVKIAARAAFGNTGQICICGSRIFVHKKIANEFIEKLKNECEKSYASKIGNPLTSMYGCLISQEHRKKVERYVELAKKEGGKILCGGARPDNLAKPFCDGAFYMPTIIVGLDAMTSKCATEEIFGPVVTIHEWDDEKEVMKQINNVEYGLSASVWTENIKRGHRLAGQIQSGMVWVNCWAPSSHGLRPFGGVKQSGNGRENGKYAYEFYTECKNICIKL
eukprot:432744_1